MSEGSPAPSAPAAAPAAPPTSPGAAPSAPSGGPPSPTPSGAPEGASGPPAPKRDPIPWKTKVRLAEHEDERELELDAAPFLESYRRKVKIDGQEMEVGVDDMAKSFERVRASMKRFDEAAKLRKEAEAKVTQLQQREQQLESVLRDPAKALQLVKRTLGEDVYLQAIAQEIRERLDYEQLPEDQRRMRDQMTAAERKAADRERALARQQRELEQREQQIRAAEEQRAQALAETRRGELIAEWTPMLERAGLPAKLGDKPNMRILRMVAQTLSEARANSVAMTTQEAIDLVREEYEALVGHTLKQRQEQALSAAEQQPGRGEPVATAPQRREPQRQRAGSLEEYQRELRKSWMR